jgi:hypothetical protein
MAVTRPVEPFVHGTVAPRGSKRPKSGGSVRRRARMHRQVRLSVAVASAASSSVGVRAEICSRLRPLHAKLTGKDLDLVPAGLGTSNLPVDSRE